MPSATRKKVAVPFLMFFTILLGIASITSGAINASANSDDVLQIQENKTSFSRVSVADEAADYLRAIKQPSILSAGFNPFDNGQIKLSSENFATPDELDQGSLAPQAHRCSNLNFATTTLIAVSQANSVTTGDFNGDGRLDLATANSASNSVSVLLGDGTGRFSMVTNFAVGSNPQSVYDRRLQRRRQA